MWFSLGSCEHSSGFLLLFYINRKIVRMLNIRRILILNEHLIEVNVITCCVVRTFSGEVRKKTIAALFWKELWVALELLKVVSALRG